jgi:hypothetical protein
VYEKTTTNQQSEALLMLCRAKDISDAGVNQRQAEKHEKIKRWLHHQ